MTAGVYEDERGKGKKERGKMAGTIHLPDFFSPFTPLFLAQNEL